MKTRKRFKVDLRALQQNLERDLSVAYFDCTNYYFDIGRPDVDVLDNDGQPVNEKGETVESKYRKRGPEKNHRPDPIVQMGLLMDRNGIPLPTIFSGNESRSYICVQSSTV